jgi:hypothetical protein
MVWQTTLWHSVTPNLSDHTRKCLYYGYQYRWMRSSDVYEQPRELLTKATPIQLQLMGYTPNPNRNWVGLDPEVNPAAMHWRSEPTDVPLKAWAEERGYTGSYVQTPSPDRRA